MFDDFYGLKGRPFQLTPDPDFYFESATHKKALSYLGYGLSQAEGFIVITGEVGSGKSTLVAHLTKRIDPAQLTVAQVVTSALDGAEIVHVVAQAFGLEVAGHDKAKALGTLEAFFHAEAREGRRCLLVVDESQNLSVSALEELRMLSNFQLGSHPLLQTLLLGQPEFRNTLGAHTELEQLRQRVIAAHHLEAMGEDEVGPYVEHRLKQVGWDGRPAIAPEVFAELFAASGGIPRKVNQVMSRLLLLGAVEQSEALSVEMLGEVVAEMSQDIGSGEASIDAVEPQYDTAHEVSETSARNWVVTAEGESDQPAAAPATPAIDEQRLIELEAAVAEIAARPQVELPEFPEIPEIPHVPEGLEETLADMQRRMEDQEQSVRHVLAMLIEWLEDDQTRKAA